MENNTKEQENREEESETKLPKLEITFVVSNPMNFIFEILGAAFESPELPEGKAFDALITMLMPNFNLTIETIAETTKDLTPEEIKQIIMMVEESENFCFVKDCEVCKRGNEIKKVLSEQPAAI